MESRTMEKQLLGHYWQSGTPGSGQIIIYFYEIRAREKGLLNIKQLAIWTETIRGRITYRTEPAPFSIKSTKNNQEFILTLDEINQGSITVLPDYFVLDQPTNTYQFSILSDAEVREVYQPLS